MTLKENNNIKTKKNTNGSNGNRYANRRKPKKLKVIPLGGLHEIGKNMTLLEYGEDIIAIDCGMMFPNSEQYGIDAVIPDFTYLAENGKKIKGVVITHAHEDHIGGVPYLLKQLNVPIYGSKLTIGFIRHRLKEHNINNAKLVEIEADDTIKLGCFTVTPVHTTHSVADTFALCIDTPVGKVFHTGDFKFDFTPVDGEPIDIGKIAKIGEEGVLLMLSDSTNAVKKGYTPSEAVVGESLSSIFAQTKNRIIIATFSSNVHRIQKVIDLAAAHGRKIAVSGKSMENTINIAKELGYLNVPDDIIVSLKQVKQYDDSKLVILSTGSQGEPMSALFRIAAGDHKFVTIRKGDVVVLSSSPIPGNEKDVYNIVNTLMAKGADVIYSDIAATHVSGHACEEDLKLMLTLIKPKFFMPVHGEIRHLICHSNIAQSLGISSKNIIPASNGNVIEITKDRAKVSSESVPAVDVLVDGLGVGDVGAAVLYERKILSTSGVVVISAVFDKKTNKILNGPDIKTKGLIFVKEYGVILEDAEKMLRKTVSDAIKARKNRAQIEKLIVDTLKKYIYQKINRDPVIVPVFMEV